PPPPLAAQRDTLSAPLGDTDTAVVRGRLPNGVAYYVRRNAEPPERAELRLVIDAGSLVEDDDQRGLAHFVEHMAFNGTRRFAKQEIVDYLESIGMRFGPDINAYTSFDETVYQLSLPTDTPGVLEKGLDILEDWATGITFDTAEVRKERGVVVEEWRLGRGAGARVRDRQFPVLFGGSRYAGRLPIGDVETLRTFDPAALVRFYRDWYRPDLMAVVAVGDFDVRRVEAMIRERFGRIPAAANPRPRPKFDVPAHEGTRYSIATDPELPSSVVSIVRKVPARTLRTGADYRASIVESLYGGMLDDRLGEITQRPDAPFVNVSSYRGSLLRPVDAYFLAAQVPEGGAERGLGALLTEAERAARHGFTAPELERERADLLRAWEQIYAERGKTPSGQYAGQYTGHFLSGGPLIDIETEYALNRALIPTVTIAEIDAVAREALGRSNRAVLVSGPAATAAPTPERLAAVADSAARAEVAAYTEETSEAPLLARAPAPGRVVSTRTVDEVGVTEWTLSNGIRVLLKPTDYREDEVVLVGRSPGGLSLVPDSLYLDAQVADAAAQVGGLGELSVVDLTRRLAGKAAGAGAGVDELGESVGGYASPRDLETLFQIVYLRMTAPRRDSVAWRAYLERARETLRNRSLSPEGALGDTLHAVLTQGHPRARRLTSASFDSVSLDRALAIYRERFADAGDFTFYLVGRFSPDSIRPLVETYLGGLPSTGRRETWRDVGVRGPRGIVRKTVRRGLEPQARTALVFEGPVEFDRRTVSLLRTLADALEIRLREQLREELGGTYGVSVSGNAGRDPRPEYQFSVDFGADPARLDELSRVVFAQIDSLKNQGPTERDLQKVREAQRRSRETDLRDNQYWTSALVSYDRYGWDFRLIDDDPMSMTFTPADVREAARRFLDTSNYVQVSLVPEGPPAGS
ncbi:MAG TPA: insulinase family protein, partial [Longimicrobium sp.]|nr:insulinase family protein [Longimicrobium sp.]